ncbi:hypothetical protein BW21_4088 [Burkholderia humptydooensis]|nr:hypothetical protein BW21_4088 [Burkholderia sp. 2002721687]
MHTVSSAGALVGVRAGTPQLTTVPRIGRFSVWTAIALPCASVSVIVVARLRTTVAREQQAGALADRRRDEPPVGHRRADRRARRQRRAAQPTALASSSTPRCWIASTTSVMQLRSQLCATLLS